MFFFPCYTQKDLKNKGKLSSDSSSEFPFKKQLCIPKSQTVLPRESLGLWVDLEVSVRVSKYAAARSCGD